MRKKGAFRFLPLKWWDLLIYLIFVLLLCYAYSFVKPKQKDISESDKILLFTSVIISQCFTMLLLHAWIRNLANFLFLVCVTISSAVLYFMLNEGFDEKDKQLMVCLFMWFPLLLTLQSFRLLKLKLKGDELAIPMKGEPICGGRPTWIDYLAALVSLLVVFGYLPLLIWLKT